MKVTFGKEIEHMHGSIQDQAAGFPCLLHQGDQQAEAELLRNGVCQCLQCDLAITGSSCKPYSQQRAKRFQDGSVKAHKDNQLTEHDLLDWIAVHRPSMGICENVEGWNMPEDRSDSSTPMRRPAGY